MRTVNFTSDHYKDAVFPSPFHSRQKQHNHLKEWTRWADYLSVPAYWCADMEYFAGRNACGVFDLTPMVKHRIGGPDAADRNFITGYGYVNSEGLPAGAAVQLAYTTGTVVENNYIGTTPDGSSTFQLPRNMTIKQAMEMTLLGDRVSAERAREVGVPGAGPCDPAGVVVKLASLGSVIRVVENLRKHAAKFPGMEKR